MKNKISQNPLLQKILEGAAKSDLLELLFQKNLPFREDEYLEAYASLISDAKYGSRAKESANQIPDRIKLDYIKRRENIDNVSFFIVRYALYENKKDIIQEAVNNQTLPKKILEEIAQNGTSEMLELLIQNQIKMIAYPEILDLIEQNENLNNFVSGKISELREFYLSDEEINTLSEDEVMKEVKAIVSKLESKGISEKGSDESFLDDSDFEIKTQTAIQKINSLKLPQKVKLALEGTKTERMILMRDSNNLVVKSVLASPKLTEEEIIIFLNIKSVDKNIIEKIAKSKEWTKKYTIVLGLVNNPKTPVREAMILVKKLHTRDLRLLSLNRNSNPVIRKFASNLQKQRDRVG